MAILFNINIVFEDTNNTYNDLTPSSVPKQSLPFPPNLGPGTTFFQRFQSLLLDSYTFCNYCCIGYQNTPANVLVINHIFPDEAALTTFCSKFNMTQEEKFSMKEWTELNKIKITYHTYNLPESTVPAPALFG